VSSRTRLALIAAAVVVLVVGFVIANSGGGTGGSDTSGSTPAPATSTPSEPGGAQTATGASTPPPTTTTPAAAKPAIPTVNVVGGKPKGGVKKLKFNKGDTIRFRVRSDVADEVHVHGYDVKKDVAAGGSATFSIPATIDGRFEVELEGRHEQIAQLEVQP
jgi:hypothetical protein